MTDEDQIVELEAGDGESFRCRLLEVLPFDGKEYALLTNLETSDLVLMQLITQADQSVFRAIESDEEFERVTAYVQALARNEGDDEG